MSEIGNGGIGVARKNVSAYNRNSIVRCRTDIPSNLVEFLPRFDVRQVLKTALYSINQRQSNNKFSHCTINASDVAVRYSFLCSNNVG